MHTSVLDQGSRFEMGPPDTYRVAVARKLAVLLHRLWLTGEVYEPDYAAKQTA